MREFSVQKGGGAIALAVGLVSTSCIPTIANLSKGETVPEAVATYVTTDSEILVLPLWSDKRRWNFRDPYLIPASVIGTTEANVPRRIGFYLDDFVCGGPSKFVVGYLVLTETGRFIWSNGHNEKQSDTAALRAELYTLVSGEDIGPHLQDLMGFGSGDVGFRADRNDRLAVVRFLERIPE